MDNFIAVKAAAKSLSKIANQNGIAHIADTPESELFAVA